MNKIKYKNPKFHDALKAYTERMIQLIHKSYDPKNFTTVQEHCWKKVRKDFYIRDIKNIKPWWLCYKKEQVKYFKEYLDCVSIIKKSKILSSQMNVLVGSPYNRSRNEIDRCINSPCYYILNKSQKSAYNHVLFEKKYLNLENALYSDKIEMIRLTPLCKFDTNFKSIRLNELISIKKLSESEIVILLNSGAFGRRILDSSVRVDFRHAICARYQAQKIVGDSKPKDKDYKNERKLLDIVYELDKKTLQLLRVYKPGSVHSFRTFTYSDNFFLKGGLTISAPFSLENISGTAYSLNQNHAKNFQKFWSVGIKGNNKKWKFLNIAISRFSMAIERQNLEDKIIDLAICAEALFLNDGRGEFTYKLAHRAAILLGKNLKKRKELYAFMKDFYELRSRIVHGDKPKLPQNNDGNKLSLEEFASKAEDYLRAAIKKFINQTQKPTSNNFIIDWLPKILQ